MIFRSDVFRVLFVVGCIIVVWASRISTCKAGESLLLLPEHGDLRAEAYAEAICALLKNAPQIAPSITTAFVQTNFGDRLRTGNVRAQNDQLKLALDPEGATVRSAAETLQAMLQAQAESAASALATMQTCRVSPTSTNEVAKVNQGRLTTVFLRWLDVSEGNAGVFYERLESSADLSALSTQLKKGLSILARSRYVSLTGMEFDTGMRRLVREAVLNSRSEAITGKWILVKGNKYREVDESRPLDVIQGEILTLKLEPVDTSLFADVPLNAHPIAVTSAETDSARVRNFALKSFHTTPGEVTISFAQSGIYELSSELSFVNSDRTLTSRKFKMRIHVAPKNLLLSEDGRTALSRRFYLRGSAGWSPWTTSQARMVQELQNVALLSGSNIQRMRLSLPNWFGANPYPDTLQEHLLVKADRLLPEVVTEDDLDDFLSLPKWTPSVTAFTEPEGEPAWTGYFRICSKLRLRMDGIRGERDLSLNDETMNIWVSRCVSTMRTVVTALREYRQAIPRRRITRATGPATTARIFPEVQGEVSLGKLDTMRTLQTFVDESVNETFEFVAQDRIGAELARASVEVEAYSVAVANVTIGGGVVARHSAPKPVVSLRAAVALLDSLLQAQAGLVVGGGENGVTHDANVQIIDTGIGIAPWCLLSKEHPESARWNFLCRTLVPGGDVLFDWRSHTVMLGVSLSWRPFQKKNLLLRGDLRNYRGGILSTLGATVEL